jgi:hypothetical protein
MQIPKKDPARAESPRIQVICFLFAVAAPLPGPPKGRGANAIFNLTLIRASFSLSANFDKLTLVGH